MRYSGSIRTPRTASSAVPDVAAVEDQEIKKRTKTLRYEVSKSQKYVVVD